MLFDLKLMMIKNYRPPVLRRLKRRAGAIGGRAGFVVAWHFVLGPTPTASVGFR